MPSVYGLIIKDGVNYSHDTAASISYSNTTSGLTATTVQAAIDELVGAAGSGGHTIINDSGTSLAQKDNLQFKGVYTQNNGDNTEVDICRTMTKAQMEALSGEALKGFIETSDEPDSLPLTAEWVEYETGVSVKEALDNKVSKSGDTMTGNLNVLANVVSARENGTTTADGTSYIIAGNDKPSGTAGNSRGIYRCYSKSNKYVELTATNITSDRQILLPDNAGTIALREDFNVNITETRFYLARPQGLALIEAPIPFAGRKPSSVSVTNAKYYSGANWVNLTVESTSIMDNCILMECTVPSGFEQGKVYWGQAQIVATYS